MVDIKFKCYKNALKSLILIFIVLNIEMHFWKRIFYFICCSGTSSVSALMLHCRLFVVFQSKYYISQIALNVTTNKNNYLSYLCCSFPNLNENNCGFFSKSITAIVESYICNLVVRKQMKMPLTSPFHYIKVFIVKV